MTDLLRLLIVGALWLAAALVVLGMLAIIVSPVLAVLWVLLTM